MAIDRTQLLSRTARRYKLVALPTGGEAKIKNMTTGEMRALRQSMQDPKGELIRKRSARLFEYLVAGCLVDDSDHLILCDADVTKGELDNIDGADLTALVEACKAFTGFAHDGDWSAIEDAAKNSASTPANSS